MERWIFYTFLIEWYTPTEEIVKCFDSEDAVDVADVANADLEEQGLLTPADDQRLEREK